MSNDHSLLEQAVIRHSAATGPGSPDVWGVYEPDTGSIQYVCADPSSGKAALIDVVWNFDPTDYSTSVTSLEKVLELVRAKGLSVEWILDTHPHADHLMASSELKARTGAPNGIGEKVEAIAELWRDYYHLPGAFDPPRDFDRLFADGESFAIGELEVRVLLSPGHTLGSITYVCEDAAFIHDTLMQPDAGTSRADFPGGSVEELWESIQGILSLPAHTRLFIGHDYGTEDRPEPMWEASVAEQRAHNIHVHEGTRKEEFIRTRNAKDATLSFPDRMLAALQINLRAGQLPPAESNGRHYLKLPVNRFRDRR